MDEDDQFELEVPIFIELKPSSFAHNDLGVFCTMPLSSDEHLGYFKGKIRKLMSQCGDPTYVWTILSSRQVPLFYVDATDPKDSNWLRFIRSTSDVNKYNTICMQQNQQINYFTFKDIKSGDELVTYYPNKKKKKKNYQHKSYKLAEPDSERKSSEAVVSLKSKDDQANDPFKLAIVELELAERTLERQLSKCPFCQFVVATDMSQDLEQNPIRAHFFETHLIQDLARLNGESSTNGTEGFNGDDMDFKSDKLFANLMSSMLDKIEESLLKEPIFYFNCHICNSSKDSFKTKEGLIDHFQAKHSQGILENVQCFFCKETFSWEEDDFEEYLGHLNENHVKELTKTQLIWPAEDSYCLSFVPTMSQLNELLVGVKGENGNVKVEKEFKTKDTKKVGMDEGALNGNEENMDEDTQSTKSSMAFSVTNESSNKASESSNYKEEIEENPKTKRVCQVEEGDEESNSKLEESTKSERDAQKSESNNNADQNQRQRKEETPSPTLSSNQPTKTYTCQLCKKQFEQRMELSKHQCIELNLKLLKKKKDMRKKKWREAHWKRKIDLSYIETTSLTAISQNIADNLSFCIDGTSEDLKAYSREVKDYLSTELGNETQTQMALRSLNLYEKIVPKQLLSNSQDPTIVNQAMETSIQNKSDSYFVDCIYNENACLSQLTTAKNTSTSRATANSVNSNFQCKYCRAKRARFSELVQHQRDCHKKNLKTSFDFYDHAKEHQLSEDPLICSDEMTGNDAQQKKSCPLSTNLYNTSAIGYLSSDPFAYIINLYWDQKLPKKCEKCGVVLNRVKYRKHVATCSEEEVVMDETSGTENNDEADPTNDKDVDMKAEPMERTERNELFVIKEEPVACDSSNTTEQICAEVMEFLINSIESNIQETTTNKKNTSPTKRSVRDMHDSEPYPASKDLAPIITASKPSPSKQSKLKSQLEINMKTEPIVLDFSESDNPNNLRASSRLRRSSQQHKSENESSSSMTSPAHSLADSPSKASFSTAESLEYKRSKFQSLVSVQNINNRKIHTCERCGLEFTSANSVFRHQEKSCLRVRVINLKPGGETTNQGSLTSKKKCPICSCIFYSTHRVSIHIYKHHKNLLGSALQPPSIEAKRLNEAQLKKVNSSVSNHGENDDALDTEQEEEVIGTDLEDETEAEETTKFAKIEAISELDLTTAAASSTDVTNSSRRSNASKMNFSF